MYGDNQQASEAEVCQSAQQVPVARDQSELFSAQETGEGMGPASRLKEEESAICAIVANRLVRARKACGYKEWAVSDHLGHSNLTMISLFENGHRPPSLRNLVLLADFYGVTTDYLLGRTDDLDLAPEEGNQTLLVGALKGSLTAHIEKFLEAIARSAAVSVEGLSADRTLLDRVTSMVAEARAALDVIRQHHGAAFDELRGGAKLKRTVEEMEHTLEARQRRKQLEKALANYEHPICTPKEIEQIVQHALFA